LIKLNEHSFTELYSFVLNQKDCFLFVFVFKNFDAVVCTAVQKPVLCH